MMGRRVWPIAVNDLSAMLVVGGCLLAARETYALSAEMGDNPQSIRRVHLEVGQGADRI
jgi:hypothetical protein